MSSGHERDGWEHGWDGHEAQQRARLSKLPLLEKLRWLEESHQLVLQLAKAAPASAARADDDGDVTRFSR